MRLSLLTLLIPAILLAASPPSGYKDLSTVYSEMDSIAAANPTLCKKHDLTGWLGTPQTIQNRSLYAWKFSSNVEADEDEPAYLIIAAEHADEIINPHYLLKLAGDLTSQYGTDSVITRLLDTREIWLAPIWNVDSYEKVFNGNPSRRLNMNGVDLNRNYPVLWNSKCAGSARVRGKSAGSEPETQTMIAFAQNRGFTKFLTMHSAGREIVWGYKCHNHPFNGYFGALSDTVMRAINEAGGVKYTKRHTGSEGQDHQWHWANTGTFALLVETYPKGHQPSYAKALNEIRLVHPGIMKFLEMPIPLFGRVTDSLSGKPVEAAITYSGVTFENGETNVSNGRFGHYKVFAPDGSYEMTFSAEGYESRIVAVTLDNQTEQTLDVALWPIDVSPVMTQTVSKNQPWVFRADEQTITFSMPAGERAAECTILDLKGKTVFSTQVSGSRSFFWDGHTASGAIATSGLYIVRLASRHAPALSRKLFFR